MPLYEIALSNGLYPIARFITQKHIDSDNQNFFTLWNDAYMQHFILENKCLTDEQYEMKQFCNDHNNDNLAFIAPTSYGKSELISSIVRHFVNQRVCIITPTKALLSQTKNRLSHSLNNDHPIIVVNGDSINQNAPCIAVLTQERLLGFLKKNLTFSFDCIVIDEAHELLEDNDRSQSLATCLIILKKRNADVVFKFLTPFISDAKNLLPYQTNITLKSFVVKEYLKTEKYIIHDIKANKTIVFDQFLKAFWETKAPSKQMDECDVVISNSLDKNIVYLNKPTDVVNFANNLSNKLNILNTDSILDACESIKNYLHPDCNLAVCLSKGTIYHHGSIPDSVRLYIEHIYKTVPGIKYIVTTSTLLSGVNIPAKRMFILDDKKGRANLKASAFKNLVGRICRFNEIFDLANGDLCLLEPEIHIVFGKFFAKNSSYKCFLSSVAIDAALIQDDVSNVLLSNTKIEQNNMENYNESISYIKTLEPNVFEDNSSQQVLTVIGNACVNNCIREIDVIHSEQSMQRILDELSVSTEIADPLSLINVIKRLFVPFVLSKYPKLLLLNIDQYAHFCIQVLNDRVNGLSFSDMVNHCLDYWGTLIKSQPNTYIYAGRWGDSHVGTSHDKHYKYLRTLNDNSKPTLAVFLVKDTIDFLENTLNSFIDVLHDINLIDNTFYTKLKYCSDNEIVICLQKMGLSFELSKLLSSRYLGYIIFNGNNISFANGLTEQMESDNVNKILLFEMISYIS